MMKERIRGRSVGDVRRAIAAFKAMMHGDAPADDLDDLAALQGVRKFPVRVKCATLGWITLEEALGELSPP